MIYTTTPRRPKTPAAGTRTTPLQPRRAAPWRLLFWLGFALSLVLLLAPADSLTDARIWLASWLPFAAQLDALDVTHNADKWVHLGLFMLLGGLGRQAWSQPTQRRQLLLGLLCMAIATEWLQHYVPGRSASVADLLADLAGLALASLLLRASGDWGTLVAPTHAP